MSEARIRDLFYILKSNSLCFHDFEVFALYAHEYQWTTKDGVKWWWASLVYDYIRTKNVKI